MKTIKMVIVMMLIVIILFKNYLSYTGHTFRQPATMFAASGNFPAGLFTSKTKPLLL
ncbi:TPA: hypothetical protein H1Q11_004985 [Salmonella enterica]|nr:hypothetical protein [Salmonella enterica]